MAQVDGVVDEACRLAAAGAEEGTLVWAREQTAAPALRGQPWPSPTGNLYSALVLRPDTDAERDPAVALLALCAVGAVLGELAPAMTDLKYRWPDQVILNGAAAGMVTLQPEGDAMILGTFVNITSHAPDRDPPVTSLTTEGFPYTRVEDVLTGFCRHFVLWASRWAEQGVEPAVRLIESRLDTSDRSLRDALGAPRGTVTAIDAQGAARVERNGKEALVTLGQYFGVEPPRAQKT
jgi:BirA family biotin operon repressor/biotin-[acetyl-CoA-carboxylase] ligase